MKRYLLIALFFVLSIGFVSVFDGPNPPPTCDPIVGCTGGGAGGGGGGGW